MSTRAQAEEEKEDPRKKIYVYIEDWKAPHPLNPEITQVRARAVDENFRELAEFFGKGPEPIKKEATSHDYGFERGTYRVLWVESPEHHPVLKKLADAEQQARDGLQADPSGARPKTRYPPEDLALMRSQHHICLGCAHQEVCALATNPMFESNIITIAGCLQYLPQEDETDGVHPTE